ncbi:phosphomethylethanolamine N-methyltransferase [Hyalella azteca]|uniref:phosphoethanolamine N-methyltransferase n=1 Tax=Hyalella azteca TaxID=294128 RepID=A0A8B7PDG9_HYAAZ|nr:phosphomethylethanolamine N-methyltransferase [Hyalella azteca]
MCLFEMPAAPDVSVELRRTKRHKFRRYTTLLSKNGVRELTAVDFMESYVEENRKRNGHNSNISFLCADVTALEFAEGSFDMVFSNWLLMYLTDAEVDALLQRVLSWLTPQGHLFIRESCFHQSGNVKRAENPTFYRSPLQYATSLSRCCTPQDDVYRLVKAKSIQAYINHYRNPNQLCFLVQKTCTASGGGGVAELERRLSAATLLETVHGAAWGCRGGEAAAQLLAGRGDSVRGKTVLDANCGTGGLVTLLAHQGAARVVGLTSSAVNLHLALLHLGSKGQEIITKTFFELSSLLEWQRRDKFDIVCAHDLPLDQLNGPHVLAKLKTLLKESGQMFISVCTSDIATADLVSAAELKAMAAKAGFSRVETSTNTEFLPAIVKELSGCQVNNNATAGLPHVHRQEFIEELQLTEFCERLKLEPGQYVLDVGCGTGGSAFYMAETYGVRVLGVDLSSHMVQIANERLSKTSPDVQQKVQFKIEDIMKSSFPANSFDVIYSRDTILHIPNKEELFASLFKFLKPGGTILITDYCRGDQAHSQQFLDYVKQRGYDLRTVKEYGKILQDAGFTGVDAQDATARFIAILGEELARFEPTKKTFILEFNEQDYLDIVEGWKAKQVRCAAGDQAWGYFFARK